MDYWHIALLTKRARGGQEIRNISISASKPKNLLALNLLFRYINIPTGYVGRLQYLVVFYFYPSTFWELKGK